MLGSAPDTPSRAIDVRLVAPLRLRPVLLLVGVVLFGLGSGSGHAPFSATTPLLAQDPTGGSDYQIIIDESTLGVVTFRAGVAGRLAHDHLVHASHFTAELVFDPESPGNSSLAGEVETERLRADEGERRERMEPLLREMEILPDGFQSISENQRADVRESMLAEGQLHAEAHPRIGFESVEIRYVDDDGDFPWRITVSLTVREVTRESEIRARWHEEADGRLRIQGAGTLRFTDFGIEPYRAFLGAVQNQDEFALVLDLVARAR